MRIEGGEGKLTFNFNRVSFSSCASNAVMPFMRVSESATDGNLQVDEDGIVSDL